MSGRCGRRLQRRGGGGDGGGLAQARPVEGDLGMRLRWVWRDLARSGVREPVEVLVAELVCGGALVVGVDFGGGG